MRDRVLRAIAAVAIGAVLAVCALVQFASDALNANVAAVPGALPRRLPVAFGLQIYRVLDRVAPAPFVETSLSGWELARGNLVAARHYALRLPPTSIRNDLLARIASATGERSLAREYYYAASDVSALNREALHLADRNPIAAYTFERGVRDRFVSLRTHPDAVAQADWRMGMLATDAAEHFPTGSVQRTTWLQRGLRDEIAAARLAPLNTKYLVAVAAVEAQLGNPVAARHWYIRTLNVDPNNATARAKLRALRGQSRIP